MEDLCLAGGQAGYPSISKMSVNACVWYLLPYSEREEWDSSHVSVPVSELVVQVLTPPMLEWEDSLSRSAHMSPL